MEEFLKSNITEIAQIAITLANLLIVFFVYKLTKKEVNPKLHLIPVKKKPFYALSESDDGEYEIFKKRDDYPFLLNRELNDINFEQRGFPDSSQHHAPLIWEIEIHNNSEYVATFIELRYELTIYKVDMTFGIDELDIVSEKYVPYTTIKRSESFEYLAPNDKKVFKVLYLKGEFIKADISITSLKSKEFNFISKPITLDVYKQPMLEWISDSHQHRLLIGSYKPQ